jgi:hypothetical protein
MMMLVLVVMLFQTMTMMASFLCGRLTGRIEPRWIISLIMVTA